MAELLGRIVKNRYRVDKLLGRGGMAEVYQVWDMERNATLAMKVLHEDLALENTFLRRFQREAQTLRALQHPNIVRFYELEQDGRLAFILMDYVEGESLKHKIFDAHGPMPFEQISAVMRPLCQALEYAHKQGFTHSDVKPGNIMLDNHGRVMLMDFGIARMTESATVTMLGIGTPAYMSPEQARGNPPSPQSDIYAVGIVLYEMLTGEKPFTGELARSGGSTSEKIRWEQLNLKPVPPRRFNRQVGDELEMVVMRCLEKDARARFSSALQLLIALERASPAPVIRKPIPPTNAPAPIVPPAPAISKPITPPIPPREKPALPASWVSTPPPVTPEIKLPVKPEHVAETSSLIKKPPKGSHRKLVTGIVVVILMLLTISLCLWAGSVIIDNWVIPNSTPTFAVIIMPGETNTPVATISPTITLTASGTSAPTLTLSSTPTPTFILTSTQTSITALAATNTPKPIVLTPTKKKNSDGSGGGGGGHICLSIHTKIDTPQGPVAVEDLKIGDLVWTVDASGARVSAVILKTAKTSVPASHQMAHVTLSDGRKLWASPGHPTADGRTLGALQQGDLLDGARVIQTERVIYGQPATYDLLPAGTTGFYWADGILIGSTLAGAK